MFFKNRELYCWDSCGINQELHMDVSENGVHSPGNGHFKRKNMIGMGYPGTLFSD